MKELLKTVIKDFHNSTLKPSHSRIINLPLNTKTIISVIGVRRAGKTFLLYETIKSLLKKQVPIESILFLNFEDERFHFEAKDLDLVLQAYYELYPEQSYKDCYFFFDEIQNVTGWEKFIRRVFDTVSQNIYITGSNSKLLSSEIATSLRGRTISYTLYPLTFREYLNFLDVSPSYYGTRQKVNVLKWYKQFLHFGGFPELFKLPDDIKIKRLQNYFDTIIYKDLIERYEISNPVILKFFLKKILVQITKPLSVNKLYNDLKSQGYKISNNALYEYLDYIQATFAALLIPKFDFSEIKQHKSEKKAYAIDNGFLTATNYSFSKNLGALFENMIATELLKAEKEILYFKKNTECDFIIKEGADYYPIQASYEMDSADTKEREIKGLMNACKYVNASKGVIITNEYEESINLENIEIQIVPAYKFMLNMDDYV